jgi:hypothetical protein
VSRTQAAFATVAPDDGQPLPDLERISATTLANAIAATPLDQFVIWDGTVYEGKPGSRTSRVLGLITQAWRPVSMRELIMRAARLDGDRGLRPDTVRDAVRQHQRAKGASYRWCRRTAAGDHVLITDLPFPATGGAPMAAGTVAMPRQPAR